MINIMHLTFDMGIGGTEQVIRQLILGTDKDKFNQQICCIESGIGALGLQLQSSGIVVQALARKPGFDWSLITKLRQILRQLNIDILHCHQYTPWVYGWAAALGTKTKVVFTEHGRFFPDRYRWKAWFVNKIMAATTYKITAISAATKTALTQYEFIPAKRIQVIYNGIEAISATEETKQSVKTALGINADTRVIGTVARLDPIKNQAMMLRAFAQLTQEEEFLTLLVVGDGPERTALLKLAKELNITSRVIFAGFQNPATGYMAIMDIFLLPSLSEGTSMTLLEAMSLGIPCIVSDVGGNAEVVAANKSGIVLAENSELALVSAIRYYLENNDARKQAAEYAKNRFESHFSASKMVESFTKIYSLYSAK